MCGAMRWIVNQPQMVRRPRVAGHRAPTLLAVVRKVDASLVGGIQRSSWYHTWQDGVRAVAFFSVYRAGSKSSIGFPSGSSTCTCRPPGPASI